MYGGLSGFLQVGDPLSLIPGFEDFHGGGDQDFDDQILPIDFLLV